MFGVKTKTFIVADLVCLLFVKLSHKIKDEQISISEINIAINYGFAWKSVLIVLIYVRQNPLLNGCAEIFSSEIPILLPSKMAVDLTTNHAFSFHSFIVYLYINSSYNLFWVLWHILLPLIFIPYFLSNNVVLMQARDGLTQM